MAHMHSHLLTLDVELLCILLVLRMALYAILVLMLDLLLSTLALTVTLVPPVQFERVSLMEPGMEQCLCVNVYTCMIT